MEISKFVCFKVSKLAFLTDPEDQRPLLVTGSWDEPTNRLCLWAYNTTTDSSNDPVLLTSTNHKGDVTEIKCNSTFNYIAVGSSTGAVCVYRPASSADETLSQSDDPYSSLHLSQLANWPSGRLLSRPCTAIALRDADTMVVAGEEGRLKCVNLSRDRGQDSVVYSGEDCCPINGVEFIDQHNLATVNSMGQLKVWDTRNQFKEADRSILVCSDPVALHCLRRHPGQPHLVVTGGAGGATFMWDLRQTDYLVAELTTQGGHVWAAEFHPTFPQHLYLATETAGLLQVTAKSHDSAWNLAGGAGTKLGMTSLLPSGPGCLGVNSVAVSRNMVIAGTDDEILYTLAANVHR